MTTTTQPTAVTVLLGDPSRPYSYNLSERFESHDLEAVDSLKGALGQLPGYSFRYLEDHGALQRELEAQPPELVLNFCNTGYRNRVSRQLHVPALLEMLEIPYVGAGPKCMAVCHDKAMVMAAASEAGVAVPRQHFMRVGRDPVPEIRDYPVMVKPNFGDGSVGVERDAVVHHAEELRPCLQRLASDFRHPGVLIQDFLSGPEYSVGLIGNPETGFTCLPPLEVDYSALSADMPPILTHSSKVDPQSPYWKKVSLRRADITAATQEALHGWCRALFERFNCRDYARFDFRCGTDGQPRLIDVNAHPMWSAGGMMATMAGFAGHSYPQMLALMLRARPGRAPGES